MTTFISKLIGDKRRWRQYKARVKALPEPYRTAVDAIEHYLMYFGQQRRRGQHQRHGKVRNNDDHAFLR
jgi:DNA-binding ferritin-like protein (Dps family)